MKTLDERAKHVDAFFFTVEKLADSYSNIEQLIADQAKRIEALEALECEFVDGAYFITSEKCPGLCAAHKDHKLAHKEAIRQLQILTTT